MKSSLLLLVIVLALISCDADKALDEAFATDGLVRINAPRTDYAPGAVILKGKKLTIYADNISDYVENSSLTTTQQDRTKEVADAILPKLSITKNINPSLASDFVASAIPISGSLNLKFTSNVNMDQMNCKVSSIKIADLEKFLRDPKNSAVTTAFKNFDKEKAEIYVAFEIWKASSMNFSSSTGENIDSEAKVGEVKPLLKSADLKFTYAKTSDKSLKVTGDQFYPFALRLAKVSVDRNTGALNVTFTDFKIKFDVKAAADEAFSALPSAQAAPISITSVSRDQIANALNSN
jgi:hypothetical protein